MRRAGGLLLVVVALGSAPPGAAAQADGVYARVSPTAVVLGNPLAERTWSRQAFRTTALVDKRGHNRTWSADTPDFALQIGAVEITSDALNVADVRIDSLARGGKRITMTLSGLPGAKVERVAEAYPGVAGFRTQTIITAATALPISAVALERVGVGSAKPTLHALRAGADWREPGYEGPQLALGDKHPGTWRDTRTAEAGAPLEAPAQWLSMQDGERSVFMVAEGTDFPSARGRYDGAIAALRNDYGRDVILLGPIEEQGHAENPLDTPGRARVARPGTPLALEPVFTGFGTRDGDEAWQFAKYLQRHRMRRYRNDIVFNSNGTDDNAISTGAKDDMNIARVRATAPIARALGVETFVLDDGWQARSGDWQPDSPQYPEPRAWGPRFPDATFEAVREAIAPMRLGLWMSPMHFHPSSETYRAHPEWICQPAGTGLLAYNQAEPESSSNEAGIVPWGPAAIPHVEARIRAAITEWKVEYFKFDFIAWLDCAGQGDFHDFRDAFVAMLDRLQASHPGVTFQIDETNDYRLFPYASVTRGPSWFQNGSPPPDHLLHNLWNLSPFVPTASLGQHALGGRAYQQHPVPALMAVALLSHITFFTDLAQLPADVVDQVAPWAEFYKRHRNAFTRGVVYPLLADPLEKGWTALQSWNPESGRGALLAFRQEAEAATKTIALRNVPSGRTFRVRRAPDSALVGTFTSQQLRDGIEVTIPAKRGAEVLLVRAVKD